MHHVAILADNLARPNFIGGCGIDRGSDCQAEFLGFGPRHFGEHAAGRGVVSPLDGLQEFHHRCLGWALGTSCGLGCGSPSGASSERERGRSEAAGQKAEGPERPDTLGNGRRKRAGGEHRGGLHGQGKCGRGAGAAVKGSSPPEDRLVSRAGE